MKTPPPQLPAKGKVPKHNATQIAFARAKFIAAGVALAKMLPEPKPETSPPVAVVRGTCGASFTEGHNMILGYAPFTDKDACAVLPLPRQQAAQLVRFMRMDEGKRLEAIKREFRTQFVCFTMPENEAILERGCRALLLLCGLITKGAK